MNVEPRFIAEGTASRTWRIGARERFHVLQYMLLPIKRMHIYKKNYIIQYLYPVSHTYIIGKQLVLSNVWCWITTKDGWPLSEIISEYFSSTLSYNKFVAVINPPIVWLFWHPNLISPIKLFDPYRNKIGYNIKESVCENWSF